MTVDEAEQIKAGCLLRIISAAKYKYPISLVNSSNGRKSNPKCLVAGDVFMVFEISQQFLNKNGSIWIQAKTLVASGDMCWISFFSDEVEFARQEE